MQAERGLAGRGERRCAYVCRGSRHSHEEANAVALSSLAPFLPVRLRCIVVEILPGERMYRLLPPPLLSFLLPFFHAQIRDISMRYREDLPPVLKGLTLSIKGGSRVGVVGRTGAGKSSLISALFRLVEYDRDK